MNKVFRILPLLALPFVGVACSSKDTTTEEVPVVELKINVPNFLVDFRDDLTREQIENWHQFHNGDMVLWRLHQLSKEKNEYIFNVVTGREDNEIVGMLTTDPYVEKIESTEKSAFDYPEPGVKPSNLTPLNI